MSSRAERYLSRLSNARPRRSSAFTFLGYRSPPLRSLTSYSITRDASGNHGLVVSKLLVASSSVVIAGAQNIVHRSVRGNAVDRLRVLIIRPYKRTHLVDGLGELAGLEELISRSLVSLQRRKLVNLLFSLDLCLEMNSHSRSHLRLRNLQKTEEVGIVRIVGETLVQDVFRFHELSLHIISSQHSYEVDHGIRSTMVTLQEGLVTLNASKTVSLCLTPLS